MEEKEKKKEEPEGYRKYSKEVDELVVILRDYDHGIIAGAVARASAVATLMIVLGFMEKPSLLKGLVAKVQADKDEEEK